jgi:DNA adenine methylase
MKTPIVYYGGKQRLCDRIISLIPSHTIYCEPFVGGGAVFMAKPRSKTEIINDLDGMIAIFYQAMKNDFESLQKRINETLYDRITHKYAWFIRKFAHKYTDLDIAWAFFVLSSIGFSGTLDSFGCYTKGTKARTHENRKLMFNDQLHKRFEGIQIENVDAVELIGRRDTEETFFYLDPPYINTCQSHYDGYTK